MDNCYQTRFIIAVALCLILNNFAVADDCSDARRQCDRSTFMCKHKSFYANVYTKEICQVCNVCIKPGTPVDSKGCPQRPCPDINTFDTSTCNKPEVYNSWFVYYGRRCPTCEAMYCEMAFKRMST